MQRQAIPLWIKVAYTILVAIIVPVYRVELGWENFLWFSDIALLSLVGALWLQNRLLASIQAVSVLFLELVWMFDFFTGGNIITIAAYMFSQELALHIRIISATFHLVLPPLLLYCLVRLGYDTRAFFFQSLIAFVVLSLSYVVTTAKENINWVYGFNTQQQTMPPLLYLLLLYLGFIVVIYLPSHWLFKRFFTKKDASR